MNKRAIIIGATSGIGREMALEASPGEDGEEVANDCCSCLRNNVIIFCENSVMRLCCGGCIFAAK